MDYREAAKTYVGYTPTKNPCYGCQTPDVKLAKDVGVHNFLRGCLARKCTTHNRIENCAYCSRYPCDWIEDSVGQITEESVSKRIGAPVPEEAYQSFIEPFQGKAHLDAIRFKLSDDEIVEARPVEPSTKKIVDYTASATLEGVKSKDLRSAHSLLANLASTDFGLKHPDTLAGSETIRDRQEVLFRLLWLAFQKGELQDNGNKLTLDGVTYAENKKGKDPLTMLGRAEKYFEMLRGIGIRAELHQLHSEWTTGLGYLRTHIPGTENPAWCLVICFDRSIGGAGTLQALKSYANELTNKFQSRAYSHFSKADMSFLSS